LKLGRWPDRNKTWPGHFDIRSILCGDAAGGDEQQQGEQDAEWALHQPFILTGTAVPAACRRSAQSRVDDVFTTGRGLPAL
jgi:hypothetical protein